MVNGLRRPSRQRWPRRPDHLAKVQEPLISCVNAVAQHAALAAVTGPQQCVADMLAAYRPRLAAAVELAAGRSLGYVRPGGAFYLWVDLRDAGITSDDLAINLLRHHHVAVAPGTAFGDEGEGWAIGCRWRAPWRR